MEVNKCYKQETVIAKSPNWYNTLLPHLNATVKLKNIVFYYSTKTIFGMCVFEQHSQYQDLFNNRVLNNFGFKMKLYEPRNRTKVLYIEEIQ